MKVLITGGAGYIGSILVPYLLTEGFEVMMLDNFMYDAPSLLDCVNDTNLTIVRGDARDKKMLQSSLTGVDYIIPLACYTGAPSCSKYPLEARSVIVDSIKLLLELRSPGQKIIYPNTNSGYGVGQSDLFCTETSPLNPISNYGKWKVEAEQLILGCGNAVGFRLATVFGVSPRMRLDLLVNEFVYRAVTDRFIVLFEAHFKRNYIHVRDVARAFTHAIRNFNEMRNEVYNVGLSDANLSKWELCEEIKKKVPDFYFVEAKIGEDPDKRNYIVSNEKIEKTGFRQKYSLEHGISELIKGYQIVRRNNFSNI